MKASTALLADIGIGLAAGAVATALTGPIQSLLYKLTPAAVKRREEQVRPGSPTMVAAKKAAGAIHADLDGREIGAAANAIHYGLGIAWGPVYGFLRRRSGMTPAGAAFVTGASMSLIVDEALTPALGFSAPDRDYPAATHVRGLATHLAFGAIVAIIGETLYRLTDTAPDFPDVKTAAA